MEGVSEYEGTGCVHEWDEHVSVCVSVCTMYVEVLLHACMASRSQTLRGRDAILERMCTQRDAILE